MGLAQVPHRQPPQLRMVRDEILHRRLLDLVFLILNLIAKVGPGLGFNIE